MRSWPCKSSAICGCKLGPTLITTSKKTAITQPPRTSCRRLRICGNRRPPPALPNPNTLWLSLLQPCRWVFVVCLHPPRRYLPTIHQATATTDPGCCHGPSSSGACCVCHKMEDAKYISLSTANSCCWDAPRRPQMQRRRLPLYPSFTGQYWLFILPRIAPATRLASLSLIFSFEYTKTP